MTPTVHDYEAAALNGVANLIHTANTSDPRISGPSADINESIQAKVTAPRHILALRMTRR